MLNLDSSEKMTFTTVSHPSYHQLLPIVVVQVSVDVSTFAIDESSPCPNGGSGHFFCCPEAVAEVTDDDVSVLSC